jgi:hypothetical protein
MEERFDYNFPFNITIVGTYDINEKFLILMLTQNDYKIKHIVIECQKEEHIVINENYQKYSVLKGIAVDDLILNSDLIVINDYELFGKLFLNDKEIIKSIPIIFNKTFEVNLMDKKYSIFNDKQLLSFSGILNSMRSYQDVASPPFVPKINFFV